MASLPQFHDVFLNSSISQDDCLSMSIPKAYNIAAASSGFGNDRMIRNKTNVKKKGSWIPAEDIRETDVLCGRDKVCHSHVGNKRFQCVIQTNRDAYHLATTREDKMEVCTRVLQMVHSYGGTLPKAPPRRISSHVLLQHPDK
jgi:hypothetical protein